MKAGCSVTTLCDMVFPIGAFIHGRWNRRRYRVERLLGEGANGRVYLVSAGTAMFALKTGHDMLDLQSEVNVLKSLAQSSDSFRDYFVDADDAEWQGETIPFYVMKYVRGQSLSDFLKAQGPEWLYVIGYHLLRKLNELHRHGWVFGDLKVENMIISEYGRVELVDYGGVSAIGKSIKQFTEIYDRGYWRAGSRVADEGYDLFSFAVLCLQITGEPGKSDYAQVLPQNRGKDYLLDELKQRPLLHNVAPVLEKAIRGQYRSSAEASLEWRRHAALLQHSIGVVSSSWLKLCFAASAILFLSTVYFFWPGG